MSQTIEKRLLRYMPKKLIPYIVWLDHNDGWTRGKYVYWLTIEINGHEISAEPCDSVSELQFAGKWLLKAVNDISNGADIDLYADR